MSKESAQIETIVSLAKRRGFVYPGSEIYDGLAGTYDYGPMGVLLKENIKSLWRKSMVFDHDNIVQLDSAIFMHPKVWEASGHVGGFADPLVECKVCNTRSRADHLLEEIEVTADEKMSDKDLNVLFDTHHDKLKCPSCGKKDFTPVRSFNMLVSSNLGDFTGSGEVPVYLRGETAQGIYVNFKNVLDSTTVKVPFGIAQIGKAFRNEIKPRQFVFRMREFEQMEMQYFVHPDQASVIFEEFKAERMEFYTGRLGIDPKRLRLKQHENLVFYARDAWDIEYQFAWGWKEIEGIHWRGDYDLTQHMEHSGKDLQYTDPYTNEKYLPHVIETSSGLDRTFFTVLAEHYREDAENERVVLDLLPALAPMKIAVSPLLRNKPELVEKAREIFNILKPVFGYVIWDDNGNIGKRYRRQDEIGTPFCVVIDFETLEDGAVTIRERSSMEQERVAIADLSEYLQNRLL
ncbi:MAG: glycyl-tRNA synthetase [Planctomycetota bacterium]|jgi:glycyl-tRNA synthetase